MAGNPVLFSYDGSDDAKSALAAAAELFAGRPGVVFSAWEHGWTNLTVAWPEVGNLEALEAAAEEMAVKLAAEGVELAAAAGITAEPVARLARGPVWQAILAAGDEYDAVAIILGRRGLGGIKSLLLGSVSNAVVQHSKRPVVIVPGD
jgi:nucleotide-binding universal stress UspA family protein